MYQKLVEFWEKVLLKTYQSECRDLAWSEKVNSFCCKQIVNTGLKLGESTGKVPCSSCTATSVYSHCMRIWAVFRFTGAFENSHILVLCLENYKKRKDWIFVTLFFISPQFLWWWGPDFENWGKMCITYPTSGNYITNTTLCNWSKIDTSW